MLSRCRAALRVASAALQGPACSSGLPRTAAGAALRDPRFNTVTESDLAHFRDSACPRYGPPPCFNSRAELCFCLVLGASAVVTDKAELAAYNEDWLHKYTGASRVALKPKTTAQVAALLSHCNARRLAVVPQGGNTGLVGALQAILAHARPRYLRMRIRDTCSCASASAERSYSRA